MSARAIVMLAAVVLIELTARASLREEWQKSPGNDSPAADVAVVVLVDVSRGSWPFRDLTDLKEGVRRALPLSLRDGDLVAVGSVTDQTRLPAALTKVPTDVVALLREPFDVSWGARHGNTPIWDAVSRAAGLVAREPSSARRVILLYTSGHPAGNVLSLMEAITVVRAAGVAVHAILRPTPLSRVKQHGSTDVLWIRPEVMLHELTAGTGGALVTTDVLSANGLRDVFAQMLSEARAGRQR